jgi:hypothetical protein
MPVPPQASSSTIAPRRWVPPDQPPEEVRGQITSAAYERIKKHLTDTTEFVEQNLSDETLAALGYDSWAHFIFLPMCIYATDE